MINDNCIFCKIVKKIIPADIVLEDNDIMGFTDIKPAAPVHILLIPKEHIEKISDLVTSNINIVTKLMLAAKKIAKDKNIENSGYRLIFNCNKDAGQEVFHIHLHLMGGRKFAWPPG